MTITVIHGDCLTILPTLESESVDLILTDPPYNVLSRLTWDASTSPIFDKTFPRECHRVLKDGSYFITFGAFLQLFEFYSAVKDKYFNYFAHMVWKKDKFRPMIYYNQKIPAYEHENILILSKGKPRPTNRVKITTNKRVNERKRVKNKISEYERIKGYLSVGIDHQVTIKKRNNQGYRYVRTVLESPMCFDHLIVYPSISQLRDEKTIHPTQKPVDVVEALVRMYSHEGDTVLDPFGGSGTTAVACKKTNRNCIIIELEDEYCQLIKKRLKKVTVQEKRTLDKFL